MERWPGARNARTADQGMSGGGGHKALGNIRDFDVPKYSALIEFFPVEFSPASGNAATEIVHQFLKSSNPFTRMGKRFQPVQEEVVQRGVMCLGNRLGSFYQMLIRAEGYI
ncbi:MAG: hypothetical protein U1G05_16630 [Kiritimatiellia bacterium]